MFQHHVCHLFFKLLFINRFINMKMNSCIITNNSTSKNVDHDDKPSSSLSDLFNKFIYNVSTITNERM